MEQQIRNIIKENLPEQAANEMRLYIEQAEKTKVLLEETQKKLEEKIHTVALQADILTKNTSLITELKTAVLEQQKREELLKFRKDDLDKREIRLDLEKAIFEKQCAIQSRQDILELAGIIFQNPIVKKTVIETGTMPIKRSQIVDRYNPNSGRTEPASEDQVYPETHSSTKEITETIS